MPGKAVKPRRQLGLATERGALRDGVLEQRVRDPLGRRIISQEAARPLVDTRGEPDEGDLIAAAEPPSPRVGVSGADCQGASASPSKRANSPANGSIAAL
jgi:hypothetical protein